MEHMAHPSRSRRLPHEHPSKSLRHTSVPLVIAAVPFDSSETKGSIDDAAPRSPVSSTTVLADVTTTLDGGTCARRGPHDSVVTGAPPPSAPTTDPPPPMRRAPASTTRVSRPGCPVGTPTPSPPAGVLGNGRYWVVYNGGETLTPDITLLQAFFGAECNTQAEAAGDECLNDIFIRGDPSREIDDLPFADDALLSVADANGRMSYWITPDELRSVRASSPSDPAPDGYGFASFPWKMTVQGGMIVKFEQVWVP